MMNVRKAAMERLQVGNKHGWQWAAGCGTDAAPYFRVFNPTAQQEKFDPRRHLCAALGFRHRCP